MWVGVRVRVVEPYKLRHLTAARLRPASGGHAWQIRVRVRVRVRE